MQHCRIKFIHKLVISAKNTERKISRKKSNKTFQASGFKRSQLSVSGFKTINGCSQQIIENQKLYPPGKSLTNVTEPKFVNVLGAQKSIPRKRFRQAGNRFLGFLKVLQIRAQIAAFGGCVTRLADLLNNEFIMEVILNEMHIQRRRNTLDMEGKTGGRE